MVPLGGQPGEREMVPHQVLDQLSVGWVEPDRLDRLTGDRRAACGVVDTSAWQLADVVEEAGQQQDVGPINTSQVTLCLGHCLHQVPVHRVSMDRIVLRPSADRLPRGIHLLMHPARSRASQTGTTLARWPACPATPPGRPQATASVAPAPAAEVVSRHGGEDQPRCAPAPRLGGQRGDRWGWSSASPTSPEEMINP